MGRFIEKNLSRDEKVIDHCKISYLTIVVSLLLIGISIALCIVSTMLLNKYAFSSLSSNEKTFVPKLLNGMLHFIFFGFIFVPAIIMLPLGCELVVTNKRVIGKTGIFSFGTVDYHITKISSVSISSSFFGKIFGYMTIQIKGMDGPTRPISFRGIRNAIAFRNSVNEQIEEYEAENRRKQAEEIAKASKN